MFKGDFKAKGLVVVRVEGVLLDCRLLLLQPLAVLHQVDLCVRICREKEAIKQRQSTEATTKWKYSVILHQWLCFFTDYAEQIVKSDISPLCRSSIGILSKSAQFEGVKASFGKERTYFR